MKPEFRQSRMMYVDIMALSEYVGLLMMGYTQYSYLHKANDVLGRLAQNIDDPRWRRKIIYHRGICALFRGDRDGAAIEVSALGKVTAEDDDVDILQFYLDLQNSEMGITEILAFMERIIELTISKVDTLQYLGAKSFQLLLAKDDDGARAGFEKAIAFGKQLERDDELSFQAEFWFCKALEGLGNINRDPALLDEIVTRTRKILAAQPELTNAGQSDIYRTIADAQRLNGKYREALSSYSTAYLFEANEVFVTFKAECALRLDERDEALSLIRSVEIAKLGSAEQADHVFVFSYVAKAFADISLLKEAREHLKAVETPHPYFETQRLRLLVSTQEAIDAIADDRELPNSGKRRSWLESMSRYIQMQPNFAGIGININNMIDDAAAARSEAKTKQLEDK